MLVHQKKKAPYAVQVPLTSLIDVVFLLLIYFLLTTNFMVDEGIKIKLPQARASAPQVEEVITVYVDAQGRIYVLAYGPANLDATARIWTDHVFVEVTGQGQQYPTDVGVDIGGDGDDEWSQQGLLVGKHKLDGAPIKTALQGLVDADTSGDGWVDIPLHIESATAGKVRVFNVSIDYDPAPLPPEDLPCSQLHLPRSGCTTLPTSTMPAGSPSWHRCRESAATASSSSRSPR